MKKQYKRIVIFPDTHGRTFWKEPIERFENDKDTLFIFLGDYFDPYPSIDGIVMDNAYENFSEIWGRLKDNENVIFLLGNHDWHYLPQLHREYGCRRSNFYLDKIGNFFLNNFGAAFPGINTEPITTSAVLTSLSILASVETNV